MSRQSCIDIVSNLISKLGPRLIHFRPGQRSKANGSMTCTKVLANPALLSIRQAIAVQHTHNEAHLLPPQICSLCLPSDYRLIRQHLNIADCYIRCTDISRPFPARSDKQRTPDIVRLHTCASTEHVFASSDSLEDKTQSHCR